LSASALFLCLLEQKWRPPPGWPAVLVLAQFPILAVAVEEQEKLPRRDPPHRAANIIALEEWRVSKVLMKCSEWCSEQCTECVLECR
jgi:hypothetical protein